MKALVTLLDRNLGRCMLCMQKAFVASMAVGVAAAIFVWINGVNRVGLVVSLAALGVAALWFGHVIAYALRIIGSSAPVGSRRAAVSSDTASGSSRRQIAIEFARLLAATAVASAALPGGAAWASCDCSKCRSNQYCCPTANGSCGCFPMKCP